MSRRATSQFTEWRPPAQDRRFHALNAALRAAGLRLRAAATPAERLRIGADFWLTPVHGDRADVLREGNTLADLAAWARVPVPAVPAKPKREAGQ